MIGAFTLVNVSFAALPISPKWGGETIALSAILRVELEALVKDWLDAR